MFAALFLGLDSLVAAAAISTLLGTAGARLRLALTFAACDGIATLAGAALGIHALAGPATAPTALLVTAAYALAASGLPWTGRRRWTGPRLGGARLVYALPLLLSLDNLVYGGVSAAPVAAVADALSAGATSGALALAGVAIGLLVGRVAGRHAPRLAAAALVVAALALPIAA